MRRMQHWCAQGGKVCTATYTAGRAGAVSCVLSRRKKRLRSAALQRRLLKQPGKCADTKGGEL